MVETDEARRPGRPARISRQMIVEAASSVDDLDALTMRELASRLGVRHGALYRWVKNRDELYDLISEVLVDRVRATVDAEVEPGSTLPECRTRLRRIALAVHNHFLAMPGYATHLSRPHRHNPHSLDRLRSPVVEAFVDAGVDPDHAEQSWQVFISCTVGWLATMENPLHLGPGSPTFEAFVDVLVRGLPVRAPEELDVEAPGP